MPLGTQISSSAPSINGTKSYDNEIANAEKNNKILRNMLQHVSNSKIENGYLRVDKNNMLFLKKELTPGTLMAKLHIIKQEPSNNIKNLGLDLHLGQKISREELISRLESTITTNDLHIDNCKKVKDELFEIRKDPIAESPKIEAAVVAVSPIDGLRAEQHEAEEFKEKLSSLKEKFNSQDNQPEKGTLRYSKEKGLYLSKNFSVREALDLHDAGAAEFEKNFGNIELDFGKATDSKSVSSKIEERLDFQNRHIEFLEECIKNKEKQLSAEQPSMSGGIPDAPHESQEIESTAHNTDRSSSDDLDEWPETSPKKESLHALILNHLNSNSENISIDEIEIDDSDVPEHIPPPTSRNPYVSSTPEQSNNRPKNLPIDDTNLDATVKSSNTPTSPVRTIFFDKEGNYIKKRDFDENGHPVPLKRTDSLTKETRQADSLQDRVDQPFDFKRTRDFF
ncbi:hypothetical protein [Pseudomonas asplenii]|uniref:hypothetical protein n=1 Tax=Pseudomonas asplenii TaxID=53407 RepID=UPI00235F838C|nr:hypothetical protein [Pseudomonas asplenii]